MANVIKHKRGSGSDPSASNLVVGELAIRTDTGKLFTKMDSGAIAEIAGGGSDIAINTLSSSSGTGGGSATFNGSAYRFTLSAPPNVSAAQLLVSINGVIQKPVAGTGQPSEGFSVDGTDIILGDAPAAGSDFFILTFKSLGVSEPADNSVTTAKIANNAVTGAKILDSAISASKLGTSVVGTAAIQDGVINNAKIAGAAAIAGTKISPDFGSQNIVTTGTGSSLGRLRISNVNPFIELVDTNNDSDFSIRGATGKFIIRDDTNAASRLTINSSGKVGIGTSSPSEVLHVVHSGSNAAEFRLENDEGYLVLRTDNNVATYGAEQHLFHNRANSSEYMRINSSGKVGIGTTSPVGKLTVDENNASEHFQLRNTTNTSNFAAFGLDTSFNLRIYTNGQNERMRIDSSGRVLIGTTNTTPAASNVPGIVFGDNTAGTATAGIASFCANGAAPLLLTRRVSDGNVLGIADDAGTKGLLGVTSNDLVITAIEELRFSTGTGQVERMRLTNAGRLGIGTTSPGAHLHLDGGTSGVQQLRVQNHSSIGSFSNNYGSEFRHATSATAHAMLIHAHEANDARRTLDISDFNGIFATFVNGKVGIGTTSPVEKLAVNGDIRLVNATGTTRRISALPSVSYNVGNSGGAAIGFTRFSDAGGNSDQIIFETHHQGQSHGERMRIDKTGRVLIGTTGHDVSKLYVHGGSFSLAGSDGNFNGGGNRVFLDHDNNDVRFGFTGGGGSAANKGMRFHHCPNSTGTANTNRITEIGEFKIGHDGNSDAAVSTDKVHTIGGCNTDSVTSNLARLCMQERSGNWISFKDGGGTHHGTISRSGSGVSYGSNSDYRLKDNVANLTGGIAFVKQLRPVTFNWNDLSGLSKTETHQGFIAHEVQALMSDAVEGEKDGIDIWGDCTDSEGNVTQTHVPESKKKDGETWTKKGEDIHDQQLDTGKLIPILTAALQEAIGRIEALEAK